MGTLGWNTIQQRARAFVVEWNGVTDERAEAQSFLNDFLYIFGVSRRRVAYFENAVEKANGNKGYIDMLWKGQILVEMKSKGKNLDKAYGQAFDYVLKLKDYEIPKCIMICDFENIHLYNLDNKKQWQFTLSELPQKIRLFGFLAGYNESSYEESIPINRKAAEQMGLLHDELKDIGYDGHPLEVYLVRLLFCLFAEDTGLFEPKQFCDYIASSREDGGDLAQKLAELFETLNKHEDKRLKTLDDNLLAFPYVNGKLFEENLPIAGFTEGMRRHLLDSCGRNWSGISPAIFGSMFQSIMNQEERRDLGAHYTSEDNIYKVIKPLFLDDLWKKFESIKTNKKQLKLFHEEISNMKFLDPACGCGNFLIITYRELRRLELKILKITENNDRVLDVNLLRKISVSQFYGIEYKEFPSQIAKVAMWLIEHQMNIELSDEFGQYVKDLPLITHANILCENSLSCDWNNLVSADKLSYIIGNPPFVGKKYRSAQQKKDLSIVCANIKKHASLDYVCCWYVKAAEYIKNSRIEVGFVSTNSICQGEQTAILWDYLFNKCNVKINFAHKTFKWNNEARGKAGVYCISIGFATFDRKVKLLYEYSTPTSESELVSVNSINGYLVDAKNILINSRKKPLCNVTEMVAGNKPVDYNTLKLTPEDYIEFKTKEPNSLKYIKRMVGADEFINNKERYCLWLRDCPPNELRKMPMVMDRVNKCRTARLKSIDSGAQKLALTPTVFREQLNPENYVIIPCVSSEKRDYIPIGFLNKDYIPVMGVLIIPNASIFEFGVLTSKMHMTWTRYTCGKLEGRYRYSKEIVYNNFPWGDPTPEQIKDVVKYAKEVLNYRELFPESTLADLYDPLAMNSELLKAHQKLDKAVDKIYQSTPFKSDSDRMELLFEMYEKLLENI